MPRSDRKKKERGRSRDLYDSEDTVSNAESFDYPRWGEGPGFFDTLLACAGVDPITMDIYDYLDEKEKSRKSFSRDSRSYEGSYDQFERRSRKSDRRRSKSKKRKKEKKRDKSRSKSSTGKSSKESKNKSSKSARSKSKEKRVPVETRDENPEEWQMSMRRLSLSEVPDGMVHSPLLMKKPHNDRRNVDQRDTRDVFAVEPIRKYKVSENDIYDNAIPSGKIIVNPRFESSSNMKQGKLQNGALLVTQEIPMHNQSGILSSQDWQNRTLSERYHNVTNHPRQGMISDLSQQLQPISDKYPYHQNGGIDVIDQSFIRPSTANVQLMTSNLLLDPTLKETILAPGDAGLTLIKDPRGLIIQKISRSSVAIDLKVGDIIVALDGVNVSKTSRSHRGHSIFYCENIRHF
jgi:hypothetical protein